MLGLMPASLASFFLGLAAINVGVLAWPAGFWQPRKLVAVSKIPGPLGWCGDARLRRVLWYSERAYRAVMTWTPVAG